MIVPHLVQYQGSKRILAPQIMKYIPDDTERIIEPFCGTCAVSIAAAASGKAEKYILNDVNAALVGMMKDCIENPEKLTADYMKIWNGQYADSEDNVTWFLKVRDEYNQGAQDAARMLFLLARVVKGSIRYNVEGKMNQFCDKRRWGTKPEKIRTNAKGISRLLKGKCEFSSVDYKEVLAKAMPGDLVYMDPPYQGTSNVRDSRYIQGVDFGEFVQELEKLNKKNVDFIVSYDGMTGNRKIGEDLPDSLELTHLYVNAGLSTQSTLNGKRERTMESLYLSRDLGEVYGQMELAL